MKRIQLVLLALVGVMVVALSYVLLFQPAREELAVVQEQIVAEQTMQQQLALEVARLQGVRETAPELEAELATAGTIVPGEAALPGTLRQLQVAADEAGIGLVTVVAERPTEQLEGPPGLFEIDLNLELAGEYFQLVDFLRRVEDPLISPRGLIWTTIVVSTDDGLYPELTVTATARIFAVLDTPIPPEAETPLEGEDGTGEPETGEEPVDGDTEPADAEVEG